MEISEADRYQLIRILYSGVYDDLLYYPDMRKEALDICNIPKETNGSGIYIISMDVNAKNI